MNTCSDITCANMILCVLLFNIVLINSVKSECSGTECVNNFVNDLFDNNTDIEEVDVKIDLPEFEQIRNVEINKLNTILHQLTHWFEGKLNATNFTFKNVNNQTKIFVKTFDFNVDFERGDVNIDVGLTEGKVYQNKETKQDEVQNIINNKKTIVNIVGEEKIGNEIFNIEEFDTTYYDVDEDNSTDYPIIDYIDMYKDTTNEEKMYTATDPPTELDESDNVDSKNDIDNSIEENPKKTTELPCAGNATCEDFTRTVYPWIVTIFVKSGSNNQFSYHCDGALMSDRVILTDARCVHSSNTTLNPDHILVFLGKGSLQIMDGNEKIQKIKQIIVHDNFTTEEKIVSDLALLVMEEAVVLTKNIQTACVSVENDTDIQNAATTAWGSQGELMPIFFNKDKADNCYDKDDDILCATYGNEVALCPSYGGLYAVKHSNQWCLRAIFYGDPAERGICFTKNVYYTALNNYVEWIDIVIDANKSNK